MQSQHQVVGQLTGRSDDSSPSDKLRYGKLLWIGQAVCPTMHIGNSMVTPPDWKAQRFHKAHRISIYSFINNLHKDIG
jgi:hypothetical protein